MYQKIQPFLSPHTVRTITGILLARPWSILCKHSSLSRTAMGVVVLVLFKIQELNFELALILTCIFSQQQFKSLLYFSGSTNCRIVHNYLAGRKPKMLHSCDARCSLVPITMRHLVSYISLCSIGLQEVHSCVSVLVVREGGNKIWVFWHTFGYGQAIVYRYVAELRKTSCLLPLHPLPSLTTSPHFGLWVRFR